MVKDKQKAIFQKTLILISQKVKRHSLKLPNQLAYLLKPLIHGAKE